MVPGVSSFRGWWFSVTVIVIREELSLLKCCSLYIYIDDSYVGK